MSSQLEKVQMPFVCHGRMAYVFPGQGSQSVGMLSEWRNDAMLQATFEEVSAHLHYDVWALIQQGPEEKLNQTEYTQVAMLVADVALYRMLKHRKEMNPCMMAGHSLGEYAALVCAGSLNICEAASLVATRGKLMQSTVPLGYGAMAALVGLDDDTVRAICVQASKPNEQVTPANYNAIGQVVIAGHMPSVIRAIDLAEKKDARLAKIIPVSVPCHCSLLEEAASLFKESLASCTFQTPVIPVMSAVNGSFYESPTHIRQLLEIQLYQPVLWVHVIQSMKQQGVDLFVECGPARVLSGLIKRIDKTVQTISAQDMLKGTL